MTMNRSIAEANSRVAAHVLAMTLLADGSLSASERRVLQGSDIARSLGIAGDELDGLIQGHSAMMLANCGPEWEGSCVGDPGKLREVLSRLGGDDLRHRVFRLCMDIAEADGELSEGEFKVLAAALEEWGIHRRMLDLCALHA